MDIIIQLFKYGASAFLITIVFLIALSFISALFTTKGKIDKVHTGYEEYDNLTFTEYIYKKYGVDLNKYANSYYELDKAEKMFLLSVEAYGDEQKSHKDKLLDIIDDIQKKYNVNYIDDLKNFNSDEIVNNFLQ